MCGNYCSIKTRAREQKEIYFNSTDLQFWWCAKGRPFLVWLSHPAGRLKCRISVSDCRLLWLQEESVLHRDSMTGDDIGKATSGTHSFWILPRLKCHRATLNDTCWESKTNLLIYLVQACFSAVLGDDGLTEHRTSTHRCCKIYQNIKYYQNRKRKIWEKRWAAEVIVMLWKRREIYCSAQHGKRLLWLRASMFTLGVLMDKLTTLLSICSQPVRQISEPFSPPGCVVC